MKTTVRNGNRFQSAFTLVELLITIAIIGVLAALLLTAIPAVVKSAKARKAQLQIKEIATAIESFDSTYGHFPMSSPAQSASNPDFTYGGAFQSASGPASVGTLVGGVILSNADVIAILMNFTTYPNTTIPTANVNGQSNPRKTLFLNANLTGDTFSPGVGTDLVYRDPWGNPYVISMDTSYDDSCEDAFYRRAEISGGGLNGLILQSDGNYAFHGKVMVWSAGPDGKVNAGLPANQGENKDNILGWK